ncbi:MAG: carboxypeptidase-like regulatory domain-containing protein [Kofleriaceae bacterium]
MATRTWAWLAIIIVALAILIAKLAGDVSAPAARTEAATSVRDRDRGQPGDSRGPRTGGLPDLEIDPAQARLEIRRGELRLEGLIVDAADHPIAGASVTIGALSGTTETDGTFAFDHLAAGTYHVAGATPELYAEGDAELTGDSDPMILKLIRGAAVVVHVEETGTHAPIANAEVKTSNRIAYTDVTGFARLRSIDTGSERIEISAAGHAPTRIWISSDDAESRLERIVKLDPGSQIGGSVVDGSGAAVPEATVSIAFANGRNDSVKADAAGRWQIPLVAAGKHTLTAYSDIHIATTEPLAFEHDGHRVRDDLVVHVDPGGVVTGIVVDSDDRPQPNVRVYGGGSTARTDRAGHFQLSGLGDGEVEVTATTDAGASPTATVVLARGGRSDLRLTLGSGTLVGIVVDSHGKPVVSAIVGATLGTLVRYTNTDDHGRFDFGGIIAGDYLVAAQRNAETSYDLPPGIPVHTGGRDLRLVLPEPGSLVGRVVLDGRPVRFFGYAISDTRPMYNSPTTVRSPQGQFVAADVGVGAFSIAIVGPGFERTIVENIRITAGETVDLGTITVHGGRALEGRVVDPDGQPVAGAQVMVYENTPDPDDDLGLASRTVNTVGARTDATGHYRITGIASAGDLHVMATHPYFASSTEHELAGVTTLDLRLQ